jgi:hypothetical protein
MSCGHGGPPQRGQGGHMGPPLQIDYMFDGNLVSLVEPQAKTDNGISEGAGRCVGALESGV